MSFSVSASFQVDFPAAPRKQFYIHRKPASQAKLRFAELAVEPQGPNFSHLKTGEMSLDGQLKRDGPSAFRFNCDAIEQTAAIQFERISRVAERQSRQDAEPAVAPFRQLG